MDPSQANLGPFPSNITGTTSPLMSNESSSDSKGSIIFGVIASTLALVAIVISYLQLRKSRAQGAGEA